MDDEVEAILCVPDGYEEHIVELFVRDGGRWGEVFREDGTYRIRIESSEAVVLDAGNAAKWIAKAVDALKARLE